MKISLAERDHEGAIVVDNATGSASETAVVAPPLRHPPSEATLLLGFARDGATTRLIERSHYGPLRVQKPLYPEGAAICHAIVVHPPGGVVGGDRLSVTAHLSPGAQALLTSPGAAKWYKANGHVSQQDIALTAGAGATLEWLPQETIFFDAAQVRLRHDVGLAADAAYIGSEILCFGRTAAGESFATGSIGQRTSIRRGGRLLWFEQGAIAAASSAMQGPLGLGGRTVCATLIAVGDDLTTALLARLRELGAETTQDDGSFGVTLMKSMLVARYLGNSSAVAKRLMGLAWQEVRPALIGCAAAVPRIWNT
ncbi:MAG: urease accessory protein UreD [Herminiimonas sp.]|nr:urease accessory protein UreD [Herminiimonas sp.]